MTESPDLVTGKFHKLIVWDIKMKQILEREAYERGMTSTGFIKYCVAKEISKWKE